MTFDHTSERDGAKGRPGRRDLPSEGPIRRAIRLIRMLTEIRGEASLKEVAAHLDLPVSTTHRLLQVLGEEGMVEKSALTQRYRIGTDLQRIGHRIASQTGWDTLVRPFLEVMVERTGEASLFVAYLPVTREVSVMAHINSPHPLRYDMQPYATHSVAWGATGRSILGFLSEAEQRAVWEQAGPSPATAEALPDWASFRSMLAAIRTRGYAISKGQKISGAVGIGAPVKNAEDRVAGSLCLSIPEVRYNPASEAMLSQLLMQQAQELSAVLGWGVRSR